MFCLRLGSPGRAGGVNVLVRSASRTPAVDVRLETLSSRTWDELGRGGRRDVDGGG